MIKDKEIICIDPIYYRLTEVDLLVVDASKTKNKLGWVLKYDLDALIKDMVQSDLEKLSKKYGKK